MLGIYIGIIVILYWIEPVLWWYSIRSSHLVHIRRIHVFAILFGYYSLTLVKQYVSLTWYGNGIVNHAGKQFTLWSTTFLLVYLFTATFWIVKSSFKYCSILLCVFLVCNLCSEIIFVMFYMLITNKRLFEISQLGLDNVICTLGSRMILVLLCRLLFRKKEESFFQEIYDNPKSLPLLIGVVAFEIPFSMVFRYSEEVLENTLVIALFLMVQVCLVGVMIYVLHTFYHYQKDFDELTYELQRNRSVNELSTQLSQLRHDMAFYVSMIQHFVYKEQYNELRNYVCGIADELRQVEDIFILSDQIVANTLNIMAGKAHEKNIVFEHIIIGSEFNLTSKELSKVLYNILENAIEAVEPLEGKQRKIFLEMSRRMDGYRIHCMNYYQPESVSMKTLFSTSKSNTKMHGKGLSIVKRVVEHNNGVMRIQLHRTLFEVDCFIPDKREGCT